MFSFVVFHCVHVSMALALDIVLFGAGYLCCVILWHLWLSFLNRVVLCERSLDMYHENIRATWGVVRCKLLCSSVFVLWCAIFVLCCVLWHLWLSFLCCAVFVLSHLWLSPRLLCCAYMHIWVRFCRTGKMPDLRPLFFKSRGFVWPNLMRYF